MASAAQDSTTRKTKDSWRIHHSPKKATLFSAVLPGLGQAYNHSYWKVPIIYVGFGALGYSFWFNQGEYKRFAQDYIYETDNDPNTISDYPANAELLRTKRNYYKKHRDLTLIGFAGLYALQILDAHVDAHLSQFDINDDLSLRWSPTLLPSKNIFQHGQLAGGIGFQLTF
ncbi:MAG: hypothetical protein GC180_02630 [Bacteroidetes bacterium]|nr:hypothetical protein [Bacteroidota bacterium]